MFASKLGDLGMFAPSPGEMSLGIMAVDGLLHYIELCLDMSW